jgi:Rrf2 family protein
MKITAQEEYGLRLLIRIASCKDSNGMSIPQLSEAEGISPHYVAKLTRIMRIGGFINSTPGYKGGYVLSMPAQEIIIFSISIESIGRFPIRPGILWLSLGAMKLCTNSVDCSSRSLWQMIQFTVDQLLDKVTLHDLVCTEENSAKALRNLCCKAAATPIRQHPSTKRWKTKPVHGLHAVPSVFVGDDVLKSLRSTLLSTQEIMSM